MSTATPKLSATMLAVLAKVREHGELIRRPGGFWTWEAAERSPRYEGQPESSWSYPWWVSAHTITALLSRKLLRVTREASWGPWGVALSNTDETPAD